MIGFALTVGACANPTGGSAAASLAEMEDVTLSFQTQAPPEHPFGIAQQAFADEVAKETGGKVTIEPYFSGSLLAGDEDLSGLETGVADLGTLFPSYHPQELPVTNWLAQMQSLRADTAPHGLVQAGAALHKFVNDSDAIAQEYEDHNLVLLGGSSGSTNVNLLCKDPITSLGDAKGTRVRVGGPVWADEVKALGFTPVSLTTPEIYEALERGVVDCELNDPTTMVALGFWDVARAYHAIPASGQSNAMMVVNRDTWESLPEDVHEILRGAMQNYTGRILEAGLEGYKNFAEGADDKDVTFVDPRPLSEPLEAYQATYVDEELIDDAPSSIDDPEGFIQDWRSALEWGMDVAVENVGSEAEAVTTPEQIRTSFLSGPDDVDIPKFVAALGSGR
jgi:TRAP-type C4-dicarboxylate transport system substrate-binding protein